MNIEFEVKFYTNFDRCKQAIKKQGGRLVKPLDLMKRWIYLDKNKSHAWIRVRDEGDKVMMCYKTFNKLQTIDAVQELEFGVENFDKACEFLEKLGLIKQRYVENMREVWQLQDCLIMFDQWPALDPFIEIEGPSKQSVELVAQQLGFDIQKAMYGPTAKLYEQAYGILQEDFHKIEKLTFTSIPAILSK